MLFALWRHHKSEDDLCSGESSIEVDMDSINQVNESCQSWSVGDRGLSSRDFSQSSHGTYVWNKRYSVFEELNFVSMIDENPCQSRQSWGSTWHRWEWSLAKRWNTVHIWQARQLCHSRPGSSLYLRGCWRGLEMALGSGQIGWKKIRLFLAPEWVKWSKIVC